jgi:hypothetical protein
LCTPPSPRRGWSIFFTWYLDPSYRVKEKIIQIN